MSEKKTKKKVEIKEEQVPMEKMSKEQIREEIEDLSGDIKKLERQYNKLKAQMSQLQGALPNCDMIEDIIDDTLSGLRKEIKGHKEDLEELTEELKK